MLFALVALVALRVHGDTRPLRIDRVVSAQVASPDRLERLASELRLTEAWPDGASPRAITQAVPFAAVAVLVGLALVAGKRRDRGAVALCLLGPVAALLLTDGVLKPLVDRRHEHSLAYPSGHTAGAAAVAVIVLVLCHRWKGWKGLVAAAPVAFAFPTLVGLALIRLDWHYPTDVLGGAAVGAATVLALAAAVTSSRTPASRLA